jgi:hypothetical protein
MKTTPRDVLISDWADLKYRCGNVRLHNAQIRAEKEYDEIKKLLISSGLI